MKDKPNDTGIGLFVGFLLFACGMSFLFGIALGSAIAQHDMEVQAIQAGQAEWVVDESSKVRFKWKEE